MKTEHESDYLINIENANVSREGQRILQGISWRLRPGENWVVLGANGAGKSTLLRLIRGDLWPEPGKKTSRIYHLSGEFQETPLGIRRLIGIVDPGLQDRYIRNDIDISGEEAVLTGFFDSVWLQETPSPSMVSSALNLISLLEMDGLRKRSILDMSRGEARKVLIARALVCAPRVLLMDEVFSGLDSRARKRLSGLLKKALRWNTQIVMATHRVSDLEHLMTHAALLKEGKIVLQGRKGRVLKPGSLDALLGPSLATRARGMNMRASASTEIKPSRDKRNLIEMRGLSVYIGEKRVLREIDWEMKADENWAVLGKNGAGKTTFLRLVAGDRRPAAGGEISRFGGRGSGSIWDLRKKIGYVSPELQAKYDEEMTGEDVVLSGFFSSIGLYKGVTASQRKLSEELMRRLGIEALRYRRADSMSYGELRKVLIVRALVKNPRLLLLDEPFSGLDSSSKEDLTRFLGRTLLQSARIILVTHRSDEIIPSISHILVLDRGEIALQGTREEVLRDDVLSALHLQ